MTNNATHPAPVSKSSCDCFNGKRTAYEWSDELGGIGPVVVFCDCPIGYYRSHAGRAKAVR